MKKPKENLKTVKTSLWSRSLSLARVGLETGAQMAAQGVLGMLEEKNKKDLRWKDFLLDRAEALTDELGRLKGSAMKAGQLLSMYGEHFLPPEANEVLKRLQSNSPPVEWKEVERLLTAELGAAKLAKLQFEKDCVGSASMGQVHRALESSTGRSLAVKVQYPGVDKAIDSDLRALRSLLSLMQVLPRGKGVDFLFEEVRSVLHQETDYLKEAELTSHYGELLTRLNRNRSRAPGTATIPSNSYLRWISPQVEPQYSTAKVLTTSFETGVPVDSPEVRQLPQERRNRLALHFLEVYFYEVFQWGVVQTDPHLGNFKIRIQPNGEDQIIFLDFGAVRKYPEKFIVPYRSMVRAAFHNDRVALRKAAEALQFFQPEDSETFKILFEDFCLMTVEPFLTPEDPRSSSGSMDAEGRYDWKGSDLPQRLSKKVYQMVQSFELRPPPKEVLFLDRKTGGVFIFLSVLGAKLNSHKLFRSFIDEV